MRRGSAVGGSGPSIPRDLQADHREFARSVAPWLERLPLGLQTLQLLTRFGLLVREQADRLAVISKNDRTAIFTRHVLDSLNPVALFASPPRTALDLGSGAGFPGIPLAIVWPSTKWIVVESREKKAGFLEKAVRELGLKNVEVVCARIEDLASARGEASREEPIESVFVRALGDLPKLFSSVSSLAADGARWVYFMGAGGDPGSLASELGPYGSEARVEKGAFGGLLFHGALGANVPRGTFS